MTRRDCRLFDVEGREVFLTMLCPRCLHHRPFKAFGIRRMADGKLRSIPWCRTCRGGERSTKPPKPPARRRATAMESTIAHARERLAARGIRVEAPC